MRFRSGSVAIKELPETLTFKQGRTFFRELEISMTIDRPCIVLDCSKVRVMDSSAIHLMLCCLEEAMKRNGDVKLSAVSQEAREVLKLNRADRLFKMYDTNAEASNSFYHRPSHTKHVPTHVGVHESKSEAPQDSEIAA